MKGFKLLVSSVFGLTLGCYSLWFRLWGLGVYGFAVEGFLALTAAASELSNYIVAVVLATVQDRVALDKHEKPVARIAKYGSTRYRFSPMQSRHIPCKCELCV